MGFYSKLFFSFAKVGSFTIGGGLAMIPLIQNEVVDKNKWMNEDEFLDMVAISQSLPGLIAVNLAIFVGNKHKGFKGSLVATFGSVIPSFLIILAIAMVFKNFKDNPAILAMFKGIRPAVVALIAVPAIKYARRSKLNLWRASIAVATIIAVAFLKVSPMYIILVVTVISLTIIKAQEKRGLER